MYNNAAVHPLNLQTTATSVSSRFFFGHNPLADLRHTSVSLTFHAGGAFEEDTFKSAHFTEVTNLYTNLSLSAF